MIRKSVETRDWLNTIEPRTVRAVMKRVVEDISSVDSQVGSLFEEGVRNANSSDSSKWTQSVNRGLSKPQLGYNARYIESHFRPFLFSNFVGSAFIVFHSFEANKLLCGSWFITDYRNLDPESR